MCVNVRVVSILVDIRSGHFRILFISGHLRRVFKGVPGIMDVVVFVEHKYRGNKKKHEIRDKKSFVTANFRLTANFGGNIQSFYCTVPLIISGASQ